MALRTTTNHENSGITAMEAKANEPRYLASCVVSPCQNLTGRVLLEIIGGTIGWRVAYSLLRGIDSIVSMGILHLQETGADGKLVLEKEPGVRTLQAESPVETARQTYRGLIRQIRRVWRVAISLILPVVGSGRWPQPSRYWYSISKPIASFLEGFETRFEQTRGVAVKVNA